jgi:type IV pilus assembly protein PilE
MTTQKQAGFTLIEVMIVVVIIGVLAAIAYPSYTEYVLRSGRTEGMSLLSDAAARQERFYVQNHAYITSNSDLAKLNLGRTTSGEGDDDADTVVSSTGKYQLTVSAIDGDGGYTLTATPQGAQANDSKCGNLTLNAAGTRGASGSAGATECWR